MSVLTLICLAPDTRTPHTDLATVLHRAGTGQPDARLAAHPAGTCRHWYIATGGPFHARAPDADRRALIDAHHDADRGLVCAGGPLRLLDLDRTRRRARRAAERIWQIWDAVTLDTPAAQPWSVFAHRSYTEPDHYPWERARRSFHAQPRIRALRDYDHRPDTDPVFRRFRPDRYATALEELQAGRDQFLDYHANRAVLGAALLTLDSRWLYARPAASFGERLRYVHSATGYLTTAPADLVLVAVSCHRG